MARVPFPALTPCWGTVCCWFSSLLRGFFSGYSDFPPSTKTNISKFQFDLETVDGRATLWKPLKLTYTYFIYIILFFYLKSGLFFFNLSFTKTVKHFSFFMEERRQDKLLRGCLQTYVCKKLKAKFIRLLM